jgi:PPM family protein phosphatase
MSRSIITEGLHLTDVGCVRDHNEDYAFADPEGRFFVNCDGMGGHAAGDVASRMAVETITAHFRPFPVEFEHCAADPNPQTVRAALGVIEAAVRDANTAIHRRGRTEIDKRGMGCTCDVVVMCDHLALCAHVGDSRNYHIRGLDVRQVTEDHSFAPPPLPGQAPQKGRLTSALGPNPSTRIDTFALELDPGDRILLCTDGLADYFPNCAELGQAIMKRGDEEGAHFLIQTAKARGGADNITIVLICAEAAPPGRVELSPARPMAPLPVMTTQPMQPAAPPPAPPMQPVSPPPPMAGPPAAVSGTIGGVVAPPDMPTAVPMAMLPVDRRMGVLKTSSLFTGVLVDDISRVMGHAEEQYLPAGKSVPRMVGGVDTAWIILEGEYRGAVLYPEALVVSQAGWTNLETPPEDLIAMSLGRTVFGAFCNAEPAVGVKLLGNVARLLAVDLRDK